jgi:hypothetical protein
VVERLIHKQKDSVVRSHPSPLFMFKFLLSFVFGFFVAWLYEFLAIDVIGKDSFIINGYRLHHSLYGVFSCLMGFLNKKVFWIGFGAGVITQHIVTDGLRFVSKEI